MAAAAIVGDSNLEKMISAELSEVVHKMPPSSSSANKKRVPCPLYGDDSSSEDEWEEDAEVDVKIKEKDNSTVKRLSRYSLGYLDFTDHEEGRVEDSLWYQLMVKHNNIIPKNRPPPPPQLTPQPPPPPRRLRAFMRYAHDRTSSDDEEELDKQFEWVWPSIIARKYAVQSTTGTTSDPDLSV